MCLSRKQIPVTSYMKAKLDGCMKYKILGRGINKVCFNTDVGTRGAILAKTVINSAPTISVIFSMLMLNYMKSVVKFFSYVY